MRLSMGLLFLTSLLWAQPRIPDAVVLEKALELPAPLEPAEGVRLEKDDVDRQVFRLQGSRKLSVLVVLARTEAILPPERQAQAEQILDELDRLHEEVLRQARNAQERQRAENSFLNLRLTFRDRRKGYISMLPGQDGGGMTGVLFETRDRKYVLSVNLVYDSREDPSDPYYAFWKTYLTNSLPNLLRRAAISIDAAMAP